MKQAYSIKECLRGYTNEALQLMCKRHKLAAKTKDARIRALEKVLQDPLHVREVLRELALAPLRLLHLLAHRDTTLVADVMSVPGLYNCGTRGEAPQILMEWGMALATPKEASGAFAFGEIRREIVFTENGTALLVPDKVRAQLPPAPGLGVRLRPWKGDVNPDPLHPPEYATSLFLESLRFVEVYAPRLTANNTVHLSDLAKGREIARDSGFSGETMDLAIMMGRHLHCVEPQNGRLVATPRSERWAEGSLPDRMRELFNACIASEELPDLKTFFPQLFESMEAHMPLSTLRRTYHKTIIREVLRDLPEGTWFELLDLVDAIRRLDTNIFFLEEQWRALSANVRGPSAAWKNQAWKAYDQRFFLWFMRLVLGIFGIVELANDGTLFRITQIGRYALSTDPDEIRRLAETEELAAEDGEDSARDALTVQSNFELIAYTERCPADLRRKLDMFCERLSGGAVSTYRLTQESVCRGVRTGTTVKDFLHLIESHTERAIPESVRHQFQTWDRKLSSITLWPRCDLVECKTAIEAEQLAEDTPGAELLGERFVLCKGAVPEATVVVDYAEDLGPCVEEADGLALRARWHESNLYVEPKLRRFGAIEHLRNGDMLVSLSRGMVARQDPTSLTEELEQIMKTSPSSRYRAAIRAWTGGGGTGLSRTATLLRLSDAELCEAILELPELKQYIEGRLGPSTIVVRQGRLAALKKILRENGVVVEPDNGSQAWDDGSPERWPVLVQGVDFKEPYVGSDEQTEKPVRKPRRGRPRKKPASSEPNSSGNGLPSYPPRITREIVEDAIARRRPVLIAYQTAWSDAPGVRRVHPVNVDELGGSLVLNGYCHQQNGSRSFKLAQVKGIRVLEDESF